MTNEECCKISGLNYSRAKGLQMKTQFSWGDCLDLVRTDGDFVAWNVKRQISINFRSFDSICELLNLKKEDVHNAYVMGIIADGWNFDKTENFTNGIHEENERLKREIASLKDFIENNLNKAMNDIKELREKRERAENQKKTGVKNDFGDSQKD